MSADVDVLIVGAGHGGLGVAARLLERQRDVLLVDANARVGDPWRQRWTSLRLFTPRFYNALPGVPFPGGADPFPGTDEVAEYHERYARVLGAPLLLGRRVTRLRRTASAFEAEAGGDTIRARSVVIATGAHHTPRIPKFASALGTGVTQLHSRDYGTFGPLPPGPVLVVGARNSGAEIAVEVARTHLVTIALGTQPPQAPARWRSPAWWRISAARSRLLRGARGPSWLPWPLAVRTFLEVDLARAEREGLLRTAPRVVAAESGLIRFADGQTFAPRTVIWATGFRIDDTWVEAPSDEQGMSVSRHRRGPLPGLWIVRAGLLGSLHWEALSATADITRA